jgi:phenylacetate-coenzyme A ligase PaaK-like adenylate-forming protein
MAIEPGRYFDELETMTPEAREKYQNENLYQTIGYSYRNSPFARTLFHSHYQRSGAIACNPEKRID